ncbi:hypothetical protein KDW_05120 [Dictyobacter vulcani]|uniref:Methyltransferase domain-containing protein n=1 Tax=Dictyobacter vulcani TaxID=2607529 RepID=A0A5J4KJ55_9CHLR|nr:hypothetical protein KDW_05120 [Dictyobacter vulcani]
MWPARVGHAGRVAGVDPGAQQIARARAKAARRNIPAEFQLGVIDPTGCATRFVTDPQRLAKR